MRVVLLFLLLSSAAAADEVELASGRILEGKVEDLGDSIRISRSGSSVVYPKHLVKRITPKKTDEETFHEKAAALAAGDVEGHLELARWCLDRKLPREANAAYRKIIAADPDHEEARAALGYQKHEGRWMTLDEINEARGLVQHEGRWITPEERDLEKALEEKKRLERELTRTVRKQLMLFRTRGEKKRGEVLEALAAIDDAYKVEPYITALSGSHRDLRLFAANELGRMKALPAAKQLARRAVWDKDEEIRAAAAAALQAIRHPDTAIFLVRYLVEESIPIRIRAEALLGTVKDPRVVRPLAAALQNVNDELAGSEAVRAEFTTVTTRTIILSDGRRILVPRVSRVRTPSTVNPQQKKLLQEERNTILSALRTITSENLGENPESWKNWSPTP